ncbi:metallophosphoesterase family protein [Streptomyces odontomachi]|uniref:metallophosphoesterase family protein n=1 Tax=Streptomyces odontomachi TaxID=2944940 RepID=UPI00210B05FD|nr:metallophosphoesterase family protein [Streptomyces sp. ODS25]
MRIAVCGGVYSNPYALASFCEDARARGAQRLYCLGDLGGYGAEPEPVWPLLTDNDVVCVAGNYDVAIAAGGADCGCGYRDPRDQQYAQIMYDHTLAHTSRRFAAWMGELPTERRETIHGCEVHFVHGSPLANNDFWWESLPDEAHAARVASSGADVILATHSGLPWIRRFGQTLVVNVGVIGRPANDGTPRVCYALLDIDHGRAAPRLVSLAYDWRAQARSMREAGLPEAFVSTNETGWWTTCLEILPTEERSRGRYHVYDSSVPELLTATGHPGPWPDPDPHLPVRPLVGSPLFPSRVWVEKSVGRAPALLAGAAAAGIAEVRELDDAHGADPDTMALPELTLGEKGWRWHYGDGAAPLDPTEGGQPVGREDVAGAVRAVVRSLLAQLQTSGTLTPPRYCVG